jgi:uroporphyrin-III C-methyltransferase/precorrin-2 dehydrogenase/sirohydrochlorin ferrochelatase
MGTVNAARITRELTQRGRHADTPVAVVSHATRRSQKVYAGTLADLDALAAQAAAPALFIIGEVAAVQHESRLSGANSVAGTINTVITDAA